MGGLPGHLLNRSRYTNRNCQTSSTLCEWHSFVKTHSLTSESVNFVSTLLRRVSDKSLIDKALADPYVSTAWKILANRLPLASPWVRKKESLASGHYERGRTGWSLGELARAHSYGYGEIIAHPAAGADVDQAVERALETAALMLGASKSRGYCLEMICADFLAGAHLEDCNSQSLLFAIGRLYALLPDPQKMEFVNQMEKV